MLEAPLDLLPSITGHCTQQRLANSITKDDLHL